jgi:hypothetical protein
LSQTIAIFILAALRTSNVGKRFYVTACFLFRSRRMKWAGHVARLGEERKVYRVLVGKLEGKGLFGRPRRSWEDGIRMDLREVGWGVGSG